MDTFDNFDFRLTPESLSEVSRNKTQMQRTLVFAFPLARPLLMARVCGYVFFCESKFRESSAKEWAEVKVHFEGSGL